MARGAGGAPMSPRSAANFSRLDALTAGCWILIIAFSTCFFPVLQETRAKERRKLKKKLLKMKKAAKKKEKAAKKG